MAACGADPFILIIYFCRGLEVLFKLVSPEEGAWPPEPVNIEYFCRDIDVPVTAHFLPDQFLCKNRLKSLRVYRLPGSWVQRRVYWRRQV
ncbi:hypothetical protein DSECCO2_413820 [anaerobic digester metagenome]